MLVVGIVFDFFRVIHKLYRFKDNILCPLKNTHLNR